MSVISKVKEYFTDQDQAVDYLIETRSQDGEVTDLDCELFAEAAEIAFSKREDVSPKFLELIFHGVIINGLRTALN